MSNNKMSDSSKIIGIQFSILSPVKKLEKDL